MYEYDEFAMNMMNVYNKMNINKYDEYICIRWIFMNTMIVYEDY